MSQKKQYRYIKPGKVSDTYDPNNQYSKNPYANKSMPSSYMSKQQNESSYTLSQDALNSFMNRYQNKLKGYQTDFDSLTYSNNASRYERAVKDWTNISDEANKMKSYIKSQGNTADNKNLIAYLDDVNKSSKAILNSYKDKNNFFSQFDSEESYNQAIKDYDRAVKLNSMTLEDIDNNIADIDNQINDIRNKKIASYQGSNDVMSDLKKYDSQIAELEDEKHWLKQNRYKKGAEKLENVAGTMTFKGFADKGAAVQNPDLSQAYNVPRMGVYGSKVENPVTFIRENADNGIDSGVVDIAGLDKYNDIDWKKRIKAMNETEVDIYNYYLAKDGRQAADKYLDSIEERLTQRQVESEFPKYEGNTAYELAFGIAAGFDQFKSGISNLFSDRDYIPASIKQTLSGQVREDLADDGFALPDWMGGASIGQAAYDFVTTGTNMIPSIAASVVVSALNPTLGATVGAGLMGASAGGNAYQEMINLGYDKGQARFYAGLTGASEAVLQELIGGIPGVGSVLTDKGLEAIAKGINNGFVKTAVKIGGNMYAEGMEEALQEILTPYFKAIATGEKPENINWQEVVYSGLLGALTAAPSNVVTSVSNAVSQNRAYNDLYRGSEAELIESGLETDAQSEAYKLAQKYQARMNNRKKLSGLQLGNLAKANENFNIAEDISTNKEEAKNRLTELGETGNVDTIASAVAKAIAIEQTAVASSVFNGDVNETKLTKAEKNALKNSTYGKQVQSEIAQGMSTDGFTGEVGDFSRSNIRNNPYVAPKVTSNVVDFYNNQKKIANIDSNTTDVRRNRATDIPVRKSTAVDTSKVSDSGNTEVVVDGNTQEASISKVTAVNKDGSFDVELDNGATVNSANVLYSSASEALVYETIPKMVGNPGVANTVINAYKNSNIPADTFVDESMYAYQYGKTNQIKRLADLTNIPDNVKNTLFVVGRDNAKAEAQSRAKPNTKVTKKSNKAILVNDVDEKKLTPKQKTVKSVADAIAKISNLDVYLFESYRKNGKIYNNINGVEVESGANGWYVEGSNAIYLDLNAGNNSEGLGLFTLSHEIGHAIREWSTAKWQTLADTVVEAIDNQAEMDSNTPTFEEMMADKLAMYKRFREAGNENYNYTDEQLEDMAYEDVVSDSFENLMADEQTFKEIMDNIKQQDKSLWQKIKDFFKDFVNKLGNVLQSYENVSPETEAGKAIAQAQDMYDKIRSLYTDAFTDANRNIGEANVDIDDTHSISNSQITTKTKGAVNSSGEQLFNYRAMEYDIPEYRRILTEHGMNTQEVNKLFLTVAKVMSRIQEDLDILDYDYDADINDRSFNAVKPNSDSLYKYSVDFSTLCRKRILQQIVQMQLQSALDRAITREESIAIRNELKKIQAQGKQIEVACALCYVESARMKSPVQIQKFLDNRRQIITEFFADKDAKETKRKKIEAEVSTRERLAKEYAQEIADGVYNDPTEFTVTKNGNRKYIAMNKLPTFMKTQIQDAKKAVRRDYIPTQAEAKLLDIADNLSTSDFTSPEGLSALIKSYPRLFDAYTSFVRNATKSKGLENDTWWRVGDSYKIGDDLIASMNKENGLRSQSWSDFQVIHTLDYIAAIIELSTRDAKMQAYTKVPDYVKLMGNTNQMINLSLIPAAVFNGNLEYDPVEGMPFDTALKLRDKYPSTAGTICIGIDNKQIKLLLESDLIDYIIPYHQSGMSKVLRKAMNIPTWNSYENYQNEKNLKRTEASELAESYGVELLPATDENYQKKPSFSEWFDYDEAKRIAEEYNNLPDSELTAHAKELKSKYGVMFGGYIAMQKMADNYLKLCAERGLNPKFADKNANFTTEDNYWKLLIDRKMINNKTGEIIEQKAVQPVFNENDILEILEDEVKRYPSVKADQDYATKTVVERFLNGSMNKEINAIQSITGAVKTAVNNVAKVSIINSSPYDNISSSPKKLSERTVSTDEDGFSYTHNRYSERVTDKDTLNMLNSQLEKGAYDPDTNPDGGYYVTYKGMSFWGYDDDGNAILRSPMAERIDGKLSDAYLIPKDKKFGYWYQATESIDEATGYPKGLLAAVKLPGHKTESYVSASENPDLIEDDWSNLYFKLKRKNEETGKTEDVIARYNPYEHSSDVMLNDQFRGAYKRPNLVTVKMIVPRSEDGGTFRAKYSKDPTGWTGWRKGEVVSAIRQHKDFDRNVYLSRYAMPVEIVPDSVVAENYKKYLEGTPVAIPDNVVSPNLLAELRKAGVDIKQTGRIEEYNKELEAKKAEAEEKKKRAEERKREQEAKKKKKLSERDTQDSDGNELSEKQQEYFKDSKIRDEDGKLLVVYHGTASPNFNYFSYSNAGNVGGANFGYGFYFSPSKKEANLYTQGRGHIKTGYLNITNPIIGTDNDLSENNIEILKNLPYSTRKQILEEYTSLDEAAEELIGYNNATMLAILPKQLDVLPQVLNSTLFKMGYDGIVYDDGNYTPEYIAFSSEQFKYNTNTSPTNNDDFRYSDRSALTDNRSLLANAFNSIVQNPAEAQILEDYQENIDKMNAEEDKLRTLTAEMKQISFSKGKRDKAKITKLQNEITKTKNRINIYDKKLLKLEASKPLQDILTREKDKVVKREKAKYKQALAEEKQKRTDAIQTLKAKNKEKIDKRKSTEVRNKIKKIANDLENRLLNGTERRYVPRQLVESVINVCDSIDPTGKDQNTKAAQKWKSGRAALAELKMAYDKLENFNDYDFSYEFDRDFSNLIGDFADAVGDTPLRDMSREQLEDVYTIVHDIRNMLNDATKQIGIDEAISNYEAGQEVIENMRKVKSRKQTTNAVSDFFRNWTENPMRAVREMTGYDPNARLTKIFDELNKGRRKADDFRMKMQKKFDALRTSKDDAKKFNSAVQDKIDLGLLDIDGNPMKITKMQAMTILLTYDREKANKDRKHLVTPVLIPDADLERKGKYSQAKDRGRQLLVTDDLIAKINSQLNEWDKQYIATAKEFFNDDSQKAINEVSMVTKHRPIATEKEYIPYLVDKDYVKKESENVKFDATIEGTGILKSMQKNATQQLLIKSLNELVADHIDKVAKIYGLAIPVRNFNKVFNMQQTVADGGVSVQRAIRDVWKDGGVKLVDQAVADLQSPRRYDTSKFLSFVKSGFVTSTLAANISVWMKQAASYPTAGAVLSSTSLTKGLAKYIGRKSSDVWQEIDEHTSQHYMRRQGLSMQELGELNQTKGWLNTINSKLGKASPMNWIQAMDVATTAALWEASKAEAEKQGTMPSDTDYWDVVTDIYNRVIEDTQPMYDPLHRAEITKNKALSNVILFQTQPIQNSGILREGAMRYKDMKKAYGSKDAKTKQALKSYRMAVTSQVASHLTFTMMTLFSAAILHKMNSYRDDNKELTIESILEEFGKQYGKNFFNAIVPVFGNYAVSIAERIIEGSTYDVLSDATVDKISTSINTFVELKKDPSIDNIINLIAEVATYMGIPGHNIVNIVNGVRYHLNDIKNGEFGSFEAGVERTIAQDFDRAYTYYSEGNLQKSKEIIQSKIDDKIASGKTEKEAKSSVRGDLTDYLKDIYIEAYNNKDNAKMAEIRKYMLMTECYGKTDDVTKACQDWIKQSKKK